MYDIGILADKVIGFLISIMRYGEPHIVEPSIGENSDVPHLTNLVYLIYKWLKSIGLDSIADTVKDFENAIFMLLVIIIVSIWTIITYKRIHLSKDSAERKKIPKGFNQNFWELIVQSLNDFTIQGLGLGEKGKHFVPFIGSLFLFIFLNNILGIFPLMHSPTSSLNTTLGLGLVVFLVVQINGIRELGLKGYLMHLAGIEPGVVVTYFLWPLFLPLHIVGEMVKPVSLALRLYGNIYGKEILIAIFVIMGASYLLPIHTPFYFLALLLSLIQAVVFTLLACIYIASMSHEHSDLKAVKCEP